MSDVLSAEEKWRRRRALALTMTPVSRIEGKPTILPKRRRPAKPHSIWGVALEVLVAFVAFVGVTFLFCAWMNLIHQLTH